MNPDQELFNLMQSEVERGEETLMYMCLIALGVIALVSLLAYIAPKASRMLEWMRSHRLEALMVAPFVLCFVYMGSTKTGSVKFPYTDAASRYLVDAGSYVTNDYVHVAWTRSIVVPATANFLGAVRPVGNTNDEDWVIFLTSDFNSVTSPTNIPYAGAMTNDFQFFTTWTPGPTVHTNGVAQINWQRPIDGGTNSVVPYRTGIYRNGFKLSPNITNTNTEVTK